MAYPLRNATFWMVWNPEGYQPRFRHKSLVSAEAEAQRLAKAHPGKAFVVLESVCACVSSDMLQIDLRSDSDIPF